MVMVQPFAESLVSSDLTPPLLGNGSCMTLSSADLGIAARQAAELEAAREELLWELDNAALLMKCLGELSLRLPSPHRASEADPCEALHRRYAEVHARAEGVVVDAAIVAKCVRKGELASGSSEVFEVRRRMDELIDACIGLTVELRPTLRTFVRWSTRDLEQRVRQMASWALPMLAPDVRQKLEAALRLTQQALSSVVSGERVAVSCDDGKALWSALSPLWQRANELLALDSLARLCTRNRQLLAWPDGELWAVVTVGRHRVGENPVDTLGSRLEPYEAMAARIQGQVNSCRQLVDQNLLEALAAGASSDRARRAVADVRQAWVELWADARHAASTVRPIDRRVELLRRLDEPLKRAVLAASALERELQSAEAAGALHVPVA
jgi:hypothetical protein